MNMTMTPPRNFFLFFVEHETNYPSVSVFGDLILSEFYLISRNYEPSCSSIFDGHVRYASAQYQRNSYVPLFFSSDPKLEYGAPNMAPTPAPAPSMGYAHTGN